MASASPIEQVFFPISELSAYQQKWTIKARVVSKANVRTFQRKAGAGGEGKVFHVELTDGPTGEIRASFFNDAADKYNGMLEVGKTYAFARGTVKVANRQYNSCNHKYEITFERDAQIEEAAAGLENFAVSFNFVDLRAVQAKPVPSRVDLCGVVTAFRPLQTITTKDGKELVKRDITIADDTATSMEVTLWGDKGKMPDSDLEGSPVVGIKGVLLKEWNGGRGGSTIESAIVVLQPEVPEAERIKKWWVEGGSSSQLTSLKGVGGEGGAAARNAPHLSVMDIRSRAERVGDQMEHYTFTGRLQTVQTRKQGEAVPLHYMSCLEPKEGSNLPCNRRVDESGFCAVCQRSGKTAPRMTARCRFSDFSDSVWLTTFHEAAIGVLGMSAEKLREIEKGDPAGEAAGREKLEVAFRQRNFSEPMEITVRAKLDLYQGEARANVTCVGATPVNRGVRGRKMLEEIKALIAN